MYLYRSPNWWSSPWTIEGTPLDYCDCEGAGNDFVIPPTNNQTKKEREYSGRKTYCRNDGGDLNIL